MTPPGDDVIRRCDHKLEKPVASVIVCTRNRAQALRECLGAIDSDRSVVAAEVVIVDNGSVDHTPKVLDEAVERSQRPLRVVAHPIPGLSRARNAGVAAARGSVLVFTDDDVRVTNGWLDALVGSMGPGVGAVGGRIIPDFTDGQPRWLCGYTSPATLVDYGTVAFDMDEGRLPLGANMAIRADLLRPRLPSPFHERLGHTGQVGLGWEEFLLLAEIARTYRVVYQPSAVVAHRIETSRCRYGAIRRAYYHLGFGLARYKAIKGEPAPSRTKLILDVVRLSRRAAACAGRNALLGEPSPSVAEQEFLTFMWLGFTLEALHGGRPHATDFCSALFDRIIDQRR